MSIVYGAGLLVCEDCGEVVCELYPYEGADDDCPVCGGRCTVEDSEPGYYCYDADGNQDDVDLYDYARWNDG